MTNSRVSRGTGLGPLLTLLGILLLAADHCVQAAELLRLEFEQGGDLSHYERLDWGAIEAAVVPGGIDGNGHCLRLHNPAPAGACGVRLEGPLRLTKNKTQ